jgi:hypothetical protein
MRLLVLLPFLALAGCGAVDTSPGASGFADTNLGSAGRSTGVVTTDGRIILDREVPPGTVLPRPF